MKKIFLFQILLLIISMHVNSQSIVIEKQRPAELELPGIKKIVIGDFVNATGMKDKNSLDLVDNITSKIFNSGIFEVVDRNTLDQIFASQKRGNVEVIDEKTITVLSKKLDDAIMILGRIQSSDIRQELVTASNTGSCGTSYYWKVSGSMTVQLKMITIKTGKLLFSNPVTQTIDMQSKSGCSATEKFKTDYVEGQSIPDLASHITKLFIPYEESIPLMFQNGTLFKNPFKNLNNAVSMLKIKEYDKALDLLKAYTQTTDLKDNFKAMAWYNYGLALFAAGKYDDAKESFKNAAAIKPVAAYQELFTKMDNEKVIALRVAANDKTEK